MSDPIQSPLQNIESPIYTRALQYAAELAWSIYDNAQTIGRDRDLLLPLAVRCCKLVHCIGFIPGIWGPCTTVGDLPPSLAENMKDLLLVLNDIHSLQFDHETIRHRIEQSRRNLNRLDRMFSVRLVGDATVEHTTGGQPGTPQPEPGALDTFSRALVKEWAALRILSGLVLATIFSMFQISGLWGNQLMMVAALFSFAALTYGAILTIYINGWRDDAGLPMWVMGIREPFEIGFLWSPWILLGLPAIWTTWGIILFFISMAMVWVLAQGDDSGTIPCTSDWAVAATVLTALRLLCNKGLSSDHDVEAFYSSFQSNEDQCIRSGTPNRRLVTIWVFGSLGIYGRTSGDTPEYPMHEDANCVDDLFGGRSQ
ncbi:hypothetical protein BD779DRAFT_1784732, partial [Infundibulicybe gibba]